MNYNLQFYYDLLVEYYNEHQDINIPINYKVTTKDGRVVNLGCYINAQRNKYRNNKLTDEEIKMLEHLNISWYPLEDEWLFMYSLAKKYKESHGNLNIKQSYVEKIDGKSYYLGRWLINQRNNYRNTKGISKLKNTRWHLSDERILLLEELGINWLPLNEQNWLLKYNVILDYLKVNGSLDMPKDYDMSLSNGKSFNAYEWLLNNKAKFLDKNSDLTIEQREALVKIAITDFADYGYYWMKMYKEAAKYYDIHGDLKVPATYSYFDSDGNLVNLGYWINSQRKKYKNYLNPNNNSTCKQALDKEKVALLNKIEMIWKIQIRFAEIYPYLKAYHDYYGNLMVPSGFKTDDGYTYSPNGKIELYKWLYNFEHSANPLGKNAILLTKMGLIWPLKANYKAVLNIAIENDIDTSLNQVILKRISFIELASKIAYLKANNLPVTINGLLNPLFSMSSKDIMLNYQVSLEDIINNYYTRKLKK